MKHYRIESEDDARALYAIMGMVDEAADAPTAGQASRLATASAAIISEDIADALADCMDQCCPGFGVDVNLDGETWRAMCWCCGRTAEAATLDGLREAWNEEGSE